MATLSRRVQSAKRGKRRHNHNADTRAMAGSAGNRYRGERALERL
jgi:hypothetical protein